MNNILDLLKFREDKKVESSNEVLNELGNRLRKHIIGGLWNNLSISDVLRNLIASLDEPNNPLAEEIALKLNADYGHMLSQYTTSLQQLMEYLHILKFHINPGIPYIYVDSGLEYQEDDDYPSSAIMAGIMTPNHLSSISITCRSMVFDGEFADLETASNLYSPTIEPDNKSHHLNKVPTIYLMPNLPACRGIVNPFIIDRLLNEFFANGITCNSGIKLDDLSEEYRLSYLQVIPGLSTVVEWTISINKSVYTLAI